MHKPVITLRIRIALAIASICITVVGALGFTLYTSADEMEEALVDQIVTEEVNYLIDRYRTDPAHLPTTGRNLAYFVVRSADEAQKLPQEVTALPPWQS